MSCVFKLYLDKDRETAWLNEMSEKGYAMTRFFAGFYFFENCEPGKYIYQVDFGDRFFSVSNQYRDFMEEVDVEIIQSWGFWVMLRKEAAKGSFELYTDVDSKLENYKKIRNMFKVVTIFELLIFFLELFGVSRGSETAMVGCFVIGALIIGLINIVYRTNGIIAELKEKKGESPEKYSGRNISPLLAAGLLFNACALMLSGSNTSEIRHILQIAAIVLMLAGCWRTAKKR